MSDYTPTTEEIRDAYLLDSLNPSRDRKEFQRWLAEHDRQVKAKAWEEGVLAAGLDPDYTMQILDNSPYKEEA